MAENSETPEVAEPFELPDLSQWLPEAWLPYWEVVAQYPILGAAFLAVFFYLLALLTRLIFTAGLANLTRRSSTTFDDILVDNLKRPVFTTTFSLGLIFATQLLNPEFGKSFLISLFASAIIVSWMLAGLRLSSQLLDRLAENPKFTLVESRTIPMFDVVFKLGVLLFASYSLLLVWGINPVGWLASAGIVGIAIGFAAKDTLANLFSGLFILADSPYKIGDYVNLDTGERGKITGIGMRSTRMLTRADIEITVPNAIIANAKITNESGGPYQKMRVPIAVGAAYGSDVDQIVDVLLHAGQSHEETCGHPEPRVRMRGFGASSLDFELLVWIEDPEDRGRIVHLLLMDIYKAFREAGIEIPYSKHDVFIKEMPEGQ